MLNNLISKFKIKKTKEITFVSLVPGMAELHPIQHARLVKFDWVPKVLSEFKELKKHATPGRRFTSVRKCPAVFDVLKHGYVVPLPFDVEIEIKHEPNFQYRWRIDSAELQVLLGVGDPITEQAKITGHQRPHSADNILKISLPWRIIAPKGLKILHNPIPYADNYNIESCIGMWDPTDSPQLNIQCWVNMRDGIFVIPAGTPICQLIPITDKELTLKIRDANDHDRLWLKKEQYILQHRFNIDPKDTNKLYSKHFYGK